MFKLIRFFVATLALTGITGFSQAQTCRIGIPEPLSFEQWKAEVLMRAERGIYPLIGLKADEVRATLPKALTPDCDAWAELWIALGDGYMERGRKALASDPKQANIEFVQAWQYFTFSRFPSQLSPSMEKGWQKEQEAFAEIGKLMDPPLESISVPFENSTIQFYMRRPKGDGPKPVLITIAGLDAWRDVMVGRMSGIPNHGFVHISVDSPGTGSSPLKGVPGSERIYSALIDWVLQQPSTAKDKVFVHGSSFGGYWASVLAVTEAKRLRGVINQSGPLHVAFEPQRIVTPNPPPPTFYLAGQFTSIGKMMGKTGLEETVEAWKSLSLVKRGMIAQPTTPMLILHGAKDVLVPVEDAWLQLASGPVAKDAWINPQGMHMGRQPGVWSDELLREQVMVPWLKKQLELTRSR
jgi:esterase FrsA